MSFRIEKLSEQNFSDYETLTSCESGGGCYCSFWHQKISSMEVWDRRKKENPELNRQVVLDKVKAGFHVGVLVYQNEALAAWISVGPLTDFYWTWKRLAQRGEDSKHIGAIMCFTLAPKFRGKRLQSPILDALKEYGRAQGWKSIEAYPFNRDTVLKLKDAVLWPGVIQGYLDAGFELRGPHWLNSAEAERSLLEFVL